MKIETNKRTQSFFLVLLSLSNGPKHGYEIKKYIEDKSNGVFKISFGSLYPLLHRLEEEKMIVARWDGMDTKKPKKTYTLTVRGEKEMENEIKQLQINTAAIQRFGV